MSTNHDTCGVSACGTSAIGADHTRSLIGMTREEIGALMADLGEPGFRSAQLWRWLYGRGAGEFSEMTNLAKALRSRLEGTYTLTRPAVVRADTSKDGTIKWLVGLGDGQEVETVFIPEEDRSTACVSSQVGCTLTCRFCHTGTQRLVRNLEPAEIVGQVIMVRDAIGDWQRPIGRRRLTNVVLMGMGEPLYNYDNVAKAVRVMMDGEGIGISRRRITLSTAGVVPMMERCGRELGVNLAVSLHAVTDELRDQIVPLNRKYPIADLIAACRTYPGVNNARRITFEYVMLKGVNDSPADARELVRMLHGIPAKINLIPFNPWPAAPYETSPAKVVDRFAEILMAAGYASPVRTPRGRDIMAACGQLKSDSVRIPKAARLKAAAGDTAQTRVGPA